MSEFVNGVMPKDAPDFYRGNLKAPSDTPAFKQIKGELKYTGEEAFSEVFEKAASNDGMVSKVLALLGPSMLFVSSLCYSTLTV